MEKEISIVIPVYNEAESLRELIEQIDNSFKYFRKSYEIIFIDDGSTDNTLDIVKNASKKRKNIKILSFRRNLGKSSALMAGFRNASGKYIVTLDADLQDDPKNIKTLFQRLIKGDFDLVTGWRKERKDKFIKKVSSKFFNNAVIPMLFDIKIHDLNSGLKIYKAELAKELQLYGGMYRFIPVIAHEMGFKVSEKEVLHHARKYGVSKYKATKIFSDIPDLMTMYFLTKYNKRPLHFFGKIGLYISGIGVALLTYLTVIHFMGESIGRRPLLLLGILLVLIGVQTIFTGLLADLFVNMNIKNHADYPMKYDSSN